MRRSLSRFLPYAALLLFAFGLRYYFAFHVFPQGYFMKYPALIDEIQGESTERALDGSFGYLSFHKGCRWIFGEDLRWTLLIQLALGSFSVLLIASIGTRLFGAAVGCAAGIMAACYESFLIYDDVFEPECLLMFLTLLWLRMFLDDRSRSATLAIAGLAYGAAVVTRPTLVLIFLFVAAYIRARSRKKLALFALATLPPILGLVHHNWRNTSGQLSAITMSPGQVFYEGNNPLSRGTLSAYPLVLKEVEAQHKQMSDYAHPLYRQIARGAVGASASVAECNRYWTGLSLAFIRDEPRAWLRIELNKLRFLFSAFEAHDVEHAALSQEAAGGYPLIRFPFVAALGLVGLILAVREQTDAQPRRATLLLLLPVLTCFAAANLIFYVSARQRLHMIPPLIIFAAFAMVSVAGAFRKRAYGYLLASLAATGLIYAAVLQQPPEADALGYMRRTSIVAGRHYRAAISTTDPILRRNHAISAVAAAPYIFDKLRPAGVLYDRSFYEAVVQFASEEAAHHDLGLTMLLAGDHPAARRVFADAAPTYRFYLAPSTPEYYAGVCLEREGDAERALEAYGRSLALFPGCPWTLSRRADLLRRLGRGDDAAADVDSLMRWHDAATANMLLGLAAYDAGGWNESAGRFTEVLRILPDYIKARIFLAAALRRAGDPGWEEYRRQLGGFSTTLAFPEADYP